MAQYRQFGARDYDLHHQYQDHARPASQPHKQGRHRRFSRSDKGRRVSVATLTVVLSLGIITTVLVYICLFGYNKDLNYSHNQEDDLKTDLDFLNVTKTEPTKVLGFGKGSVAHGRDSRYWDKDDRRRDDDYNEEDVEHSRESASNGSTEKGLPSLKMKLGNKNISSDSTARRMNEKSVGLYNEDGRNELIMYEAEYEASLKKSDLMNKGSPGKNHLPDDEGFESKEEAIDVDDGYIGVDSSDAQIENIGDNDDPLSDNENSNVARSLEKKSNTYEIPEISSKNLNDEIPNKASKRLIEEDSFHSRDSDYLKKSTTGQVIKKHKADSRKKSKRRSCEMKVLDSTSQLVEPLETRKFVRFSLQYVEQEEKPHDQPEWEPRFAGHPSLRERESSFLAHDQTMNCGFVRGPQGSRSTGFDIAEDDASFINRCHIAVVSCIFGNSDLLRPPASKMMTRYSRKSVCFVMFMDEITLRTLSSEGQAPDSMGYIDLWKIIVVKNLPYTDMRRVGKIPKFLSHRLFPSARYSIWLDSKLRLQLDPLLILEYFLWRKGNEYAISNHYDRHCVWEEVAQNKKLNKYNHTAIDEQFSFYQSDGLRRFNPLDPKKLLRSNVPEGSFIVRAHTPMSNLFSCLWFNEVDRFTSRDQLSFAYTYQKLKKMNPGKPFHLNMFKDCERRLVAKLFRHRLEQ